MWAGEWCDIGLLGATGLHLLATLAAAPLSCKRACAEPRQLTPDTKHHLVSSWLGSHSPPLLTPHHLVVDVPTVFTLPYPTRVSPGHRPPRHHRPRPRRPASQQEAVAERREKVPTDEEIERTYTGLDREIAEEFISIAMQPKPPSSAASSLSPP